MIVFDIETGPLPDDVLRTMVEPFSPPPHPGAFDESSVKLGTLKDPKKISDKITAAKDKHDAAVRDYESTVKQLEAQWWHDIVDRAALEPSTGQIVAIGYTSTESDVWLLDIADEAAMLQRFWSQYAKCRQQQRKLVGHNIYEFDLRFIAVRSWVHGLDVPQTILERGKWIDSHTFVDTMQLAAFGTRRHMKLDTLARLFGVGQKPEGVTGAMFHQLLKTDKIKAEEYLRNDLKMTRAVATRMGVI